MKTKEDEIRAEMEEITKNLVKLKNKKNNTDIIENNSLYKEICYQMQCMEERRKYLLNCIKKQYEGVS